MAKAQKIKWREEGKGRRRKEKTVWNNELVPRIIQIRINGSNVVRSAIDASR